MNYTANDIAKYVVAYCNKIGSPISNLQLQKILYYIQGYFLKQFKCKAFDEEIYNWTYGPVTPDVYFEYNIFGGQKIICDVDDQPTALVTASRQHQAWIKKVVDTCIEMTPGKLVEKTHREDPWKNTSPRSKISVDSICEYFQSHDPLNLITK